MDVKTNPRGTPVVALTTPAAGVRRPSTMRPRTEDPKTEDPSPASSKIEDPGTESLGADDPKPASPNAEHPGADDPRADDPRAEDLGSDDPELASPNAERSRADDPRAEDLGSDDPELASPNAERSRADDPGSENLRPASAEHPDNAGPASLKPARLEAKTPGALSSMSGRTVLLPDSALTTNGALAALLEVGARPLLVPLAEARPVGTTTRLDQALTAMAEGCYGWLALSSAASVRMLDARARALFADDPQLSGLRSLSQAGRLRVASVGQGTEAALAALGIRSQVPERGSGPAALIGPLLCSVTTDTQVLFARGNLVGPALAGALRGGGITVDEVVTHITVREEDPPATATAAWASGQVDAVLLTSPKAVRGLVDRLGPPLAGMVVACMDEVTADVARASGVRVDVVGSSPTVASLVDALEDRFSA